MSAGASLPGKRFFGIREVAELCDVEPHVLRYWEEEFAQLQPLRRNGNRRYYRSQDVRLVRRIRYLLWERKYTIEGARDRLSEGEGADGPPPKVALREVRGELVAMLEELDAADQRRAIDRSRGDA